jgi:hypothetical protein
MLPPLTYDLLARDKTKSAFRSMGDNVDQAERKVGRLKSMFAGLGGMAGKIGALGGVLGAAGLGKSIMSTVNAADEMSKTAQKIGVPIEELSRLKYAADLSGVSFGELQTAVGKLSRNMDEAATGNKEYGEAFERLGITVTGANGKLKPASQVMAEMADRFKVMPDGAEKTALAMQLMGRAGAGMIPMLNGGTEAMNTLLGEAGKFGQVFTQEMGSSAEALNDNMTRIKGAFGSVAAQMTGALLPSLEKFSQFAADLAGKFSQLSPGVKTFVGVVGGLTLAISALAVPLAAVVVSLGAVSAPLLAVGAAVGVATAAVVAFWPEIKALGQSIADFSSEAIGSLQAFGVHLVDVFAALPEKMIDIGGQIIAGLWQGLKGRATDVIEGAVDIASDLVGGIKSRLGIQSPSRVMMDVGHDIMAGLDQGMSSMTGSILGSADEIGRTVGDAFAKVIDGSMKVKDALKQVASQVLSMAANSAIRSLFGGIGGAGGGFFSSLFGGLFGGFRAAGGPVSAGRSYVVGERGPEVFRPSSSGTITSNREVGSMSGSARAPVLNIYNSFDGESIRTLVRDESGRVVAQSAPGIVNQSVMAVGDKMRKFPGYGQ